MTDIKTPLETPLPALPADVAKTLEEEFQQALAHLERIKKRMAELEDWGMYPGIPTEQWQDRNGSGQKIYLYMIFKQANHGYGAHRGVPQYEGPDGKKKLYVGSDEFKIIEARQMSANRAEWNQLDEARQRLESWLYTKRHELHELKIRACHWPRFWGLESGAGVAQRTPNKK